MRPPRWWRHGLYKHPLYRVHVSMMGRCYAEENSNFYKYGAKGIRVHKPWHDVTTFIREVEAEIGPKPEGYCIDRIDNDRGYEPGNLRWLSKAQSATHRSYVKCTPEVLMQIDKRIQDGEPGARIAKSLGLSKSAVYYWRNRKRVEKEEKV